MQGEPWGKNQASACYYPGPVFDIPKYVNNLFTTKTFHASENFPPCSCPAQKNSLSLTKHNDVFCAAILNCYWLPWSSLFSHSSTPAVRRDNNTEVHNEQFLEISLYQLISHDLG